MNRILLFGLIGLLLMIQSAFISQLIRVQQITNQSMESLTDVMEKQGQEIREQRIKVDRMIRVIEPDETSRSGMIRRNMTITAYNCTVGQCGKTDGITASGTYVKEGRTVAVSTDIPIGTRFIINGHIYTAEDRCVGENHIDIYMDSYSAAMEFGKQEIPVVILQ